MLTPVVLSNNIFVNVAAADIRAWVGFPPLLPPFFSQAKVEFLFTFSPFLFAAGREKEGGGGGKISLGATDELLYGQGCLSERAGFFSRMRSLEIAGKFSKVPRRNWQISFFTPLQEKKILFGRCRRLRKQANSGEKRKSLNLHKKRFFFFFFAFRGENAHFFPSSKKNLSRLSGKWRVFFFFSLRKTFASRKRKALEAQRGGKRVEKEGGVCTPIWSWKVCLLC